MNSIPDDESEDPKGEPLWDFGQLKFAGDAPRWFTAIVFLLFVALLLTCLLLTKSPN